MARVHGLTLRQRRLARALLRLRNRSGLTLEDACHELGWSQAKQSRIETARAGVKIDDLARLLDVYGVDDADRESFMEMGRHARKKGWWDAYLDASVAEGYVDYIEIESDAAGLRCYDSQLVNGMLQTRSYAFEIISAGTMGLSPKSYIDRRVDLRMKRQERLTDDVNPLKLHLIVDESALERLIGSAAIMHEQYLKILGAMDQPSLTLQVLPRSSGAHPATAGSFTILDFPEPYGPEAVAAEALKRNLILENEAEVHWHNIVFGKLQVEALGTKESRAFIERLAKKSGGS